MHPKNVNKIMSGSENLLCKNFYEFERSVKYLDDLPVEILRKIFKYVRNRWHIAETSSNFYEIICEIESKNFVLKIIDVSYKVKIFSYFPVMCHVQTCEIFHFLFDFL